MVFIHQVGKFLPKTRGFFFAHPDSFSHGGECHRPWDTDGKHNPTKWRDSLKASLAEASNDCRSSLDLTTTQHPTSDGSDFQVHLDDTYYREFPRRISCHLID